MKTVNSFVGILSIVLSPILILAIPGFYLFYYGIDQIANHSTGVRQILMNTGNITMGLSYLIFYGFLICKLVETIL